MNRLWRAAAGAAVASAALALAAPSLAAYNPRLAAGGPGQLGATGTHQITFSIQAGDDPTAAIIIYAPKGYTANLSAPLGSKIGTVQAKVQALDLGGATLPLEGQVETAAASTLIPSGGAQVPLSAAAAACTGKEEHAAFILLVLTAAGQTLRVPGFVDVAVGPETGFASYRFQFCLPPPDVPAGTPGRATFGAKLLEATLSLQNIFTNPAEAGLHIWRATWTPYAPGLGAPVASATVETRSIVPLPVSITLKGRYDRKAKSARLTGTATAGGQPVAGQALPLFGGASLRTAKKLGPSVRTDAKGVFAAVRKIVRTTVFQIRVASPARDFTAAGCALPPVIAPSGCVSTTIGPVTATSNAVRVAVPKR